MEIAMINCKKCGDPMPQLRLTQYGYDFCVKCSEGLNLVGKKRAIPIQRGSGDHTWTETVVMEEKEYLEYEKLEGMNSISSGKTKAEILNMDLEEKNLQGPFSIINKTVS